MHFYSTGVFNLDLRIKAIQNVAHYLPHHVIYAPAKFEVAMFDG